MPLFGKKKPKALVRTFSGRERYQFLRPVGEGGMSNVASFFDTRLNRVVALKELNDQSRESEELLQSFINESKLLGYLDHPGVIPVFDVFLRDDGRPCYTMKLCEGEPLRSLIDGQESDHTRLIPVEQTLEIFLKLSQTMAFVHDKGVLHLDIKPDNIMVGRYGEVMVLDWGSARLFESERFYEYLKRLSASSELAQFEADDGDTVIGTPRYMSPEQSELGRGQLTCASDVFSAGIVLYQMLTAKHPFPSLQAYELLEQIRNVDPEPPCEVNRDVPFLLSRLCMRMLEKDPAKRYRRFQDVLHDLAQFRGVGEGFPVRTYQSGEIIFNEGDPGDYAFVVLAGQVEIITQVEGERKVIATIDVGEVVGELAIISRSPRTATTRALGDTKVRILSKADIDQELAKLSPWVSKMITGLSNRFINLRNHLLEIEGRDQAAP